jgi:hypothetical protein
MDDELPSEIAEVQHYKVGNTAGASPCFRELYRVQKLVVMPA